jgi:hypothetical protein
MPHFKTTRIAHPATQDHAEAVRLAWKSRHIPIGTILLATLMLGGLLPTVLTILAQGPVNPMP